MSRLAKPKRIRPALIPIILALLALACNLPGASAPTPIGTANKTRTAIVATIEALTITPLLPEAATATSAPLAPSNTPLPVITDTPASVADQATATPLPSDTPLPSLTASQTNTAAPLSPTSALLRTNASAIANYLARVPIIDGMLIDWDIIITPVYPATYVTYGANNWVNAMDLSAMFMLGWDDNYLYLAATVNDDIYAQNAHGEELYQGDSVEILLDTNLAADFYVNDLSPDDFQLGIAPGSPGVGANLEAYLWYPRNLAGVRSKVLMAAQPVAGGYVIEAAIPWSIFELKPQANQHYGFAFSVSDNDAGGIIQQSMASFVPNRHLTMPPTWGDLVLRK